MKTRFALSALAMLACTNLSAQEMFTDYFDIKLEAQAGAEVTGRINLKSNKSAHLLSEPSNYDFRLLTPNSPFTLTEVVDHKGRTFAKFTVKDGHTLPKQPKQYDIKVQLLQNGAPIEEQTVTINVVKETLWQSLQQYWSEAAMHESLLWGRKKFSDDEVASYITTLQQNGGRFSDTNMYAEEAYKGYQGSSEHTLELSAKEYEKLKSQSWQVDITNVAKTIGGLGRRFAIDGRYKHDPELKSALYKAITAYANAIPVYPEDVNIEGKPLGEHIGDGFVMLYQKPLQSISWGLGTHQWVITDPLVVPALHLAPFMFDDIKAGNSDAKACHDALIRIFQTSFSIVPPRRAMDDPWQRWGEIASAQSNGAWADANIGHRIRTLFSLPIIWGDYNRPMTYVPYWYDDFYNGTQFEGKTFAKNWSPSGVVKDLHHWSNLFSIPAKAFGQSGFNPDGSNTHHLGSKYVPGKIKALGRASDFAMTAYGYDWMMQARYAAAIFKDSAMPLDNKVYQFPIDKLNYTYQRLIYKGAIDFVAAGRSSMDDQKRWVNRNLVHDLEQLLSHKAPSTQITGEQEALAFAHAAKKGINKFSATTAFFNADYLVHRREDDQNQFFFSVKNKSERTSGAEDFSKTRKTWHLASGLLQLRINGEEYHQNVRLNWDFHALPGVTEEWGQNPFPKRGGANAAGPGDNRLSGVLSDGEHGSSLYRHRPRASHNYATADKSVFFAHNRAVAIGNNINRTGEGEGRPIITTIDQSRQVEPISYNINGEYGHIEYGHVDKTLTLTSPAWIHHGQKGYLIIPKGEQPLYIQTGNKINTTDTNPEKLDQQRRSESFFSSRPHNFLIALGHGINPAASNLNNYHYVLLANVSEKDMDSHLANYLAQVNTTEQASQYHLLEDKQHQLVQANFWQQGKAKLASGHISASSSAMIQYADKGDHYLISISDPSHDVKLKQLVVELPIELQTGRYSYQAAGMKPFKAESVEVSRNRNGSRLVVELANEGDAIYQSREALYAGAPIVITVPKG